MLDLLVTTATLPVGRTGMSVAVQDGRITEVAPGLQVPAHETLDAQGLLLSPPFVDAHFHMDATLSYGMPRVNPLINITLQGRHDTYPKRRGMTRVPELLAVGVNVAFGQDCCMDPWYSLGSGDMLEVAHMGLHVAQMTGQAPSAAWSDSGCGACGQDKGRAEHGEGLQQAPLRWLCFLPHAPAIADARICSGMSIQTWLERLVSDTTSRSKI